MEIGKRNHQSIRFLIVLILCFSSMLLGTQVVKADDTSDTLFHSTGISKIGKTYYINGEDGNDENDGLSPKKAWKSLNKASSTTFEPGDHILLESSSTWINQILHPKGNGEDGKEIKIDFYVQEKNGSASYDSNKRPVIHGGGTYGTGSFKRYITGAVQLVNQEYWEIHNLEVTNTPDLSDEEGYKIPGDAQRAGILLLGYEQNRTFNNFVVKNCYVHDVQSEYYLKFSGAKESRRLKAVGGIIILGHWVDPDGNYVLNDGDHRSTTGFNNVLIENNVVKRVGLEGIRTKCDADTSVSNTFHKKFSNITIKNNYLEEISGDAIVLSEVASGGLVDGNVAKKACNADYGTHNYAGIWSMSNNDAVFQYNEVYGTIHGYNDAEAYDIDMQCNNVIYQYNYSHHNSGGFLLLMNDQRNSIVRYNISANDGGGNKGTNADGGGGSSYNYKEQSIFHYWVKNDNASMPLIHNNTFYVGDGISTSLFGEGNSSDNSGTVAHFYNNILYKEGSGSLKFLTNYTPNGNEPTERKMVDNPENYFKNNIIWPASVASETSGATVEKLTVGQNKFEEPKLAIIGNTELQQSLAKQNDTLINSDTDSIVTFTSRDKMRERASMFKISADSPAVGSGQVITNNTGEDFFGNNTLNKAPDIGAHQVSDIEKTTEIDPISINLTTYTGVYPKLPSELEITIRDIYGEVVNERKETHSIEWESIPKEKYQQAGTIVITGTILDIDSTEAKATATIEVKGNLGEGKLTSTVLAKDGAYVQRGSATTAFGTKTGASSTPATKDLYKYPFGVSYSDNFVLKLKNAGSAGYNRRFYVKFDPKTYEGNLDEIKNASIQLYISRYDSWKGAGSDTQEQLENTSFALDVYGTDTDWSSDTLTWNNGPLNQQVTENNHPNLGSAEQIPDYKNLAPISHTIYKNSDIISNGHVINIDVSEYLRNLKDVSQEVSFLIDIPMSKLAGFDRDNSGFDAFSVVGAEQAYTDYQNGKLTLPKDFSSDFTMSEDSLAPKLVISDVYETDVKLIHVETSLGEQPILPDTVTVNYSDGSNKEVRVTWNDISQDLYSKEGKFTISGTAIGINSPIIATVSVKGDAIVSFKNLEKIDTIVGLARGDLGLPTEATAFLESGKEVTVPVTGWDDDVSNYTQESKPGTYSFPGAFELPDGVSNPQELKIFQIVETHPKPETIVFSEKKLQVAKNNSLLIEKSVIGAKPYTDVDEWGSQLKWEIEPVDSNINENFPTITDQGLIETNENTPVGEYIIKATSSRVSDVSSTIQLIVSDSDSAEIEKIELNVKALELLKKGKTLSIKTTITPPNADSTSLIWTSKKTDVATVDSNGVVTAKSPGITTITVSSSNGKTAQFTLRVTQ